MTVSAMEGSCAFIMLADINREGDPDCKEHSPVDKFESEDEVMVAERAVDHSGSQDPDEREDGPSTLFNVIPIYLGSTYSSNCESDFTPTRENREGVSRKRHDEGREYPLDGTQGQGPRSTSDCGMNGHSGERRVEMM